WGCCRGARLTLVRAGCSLCQFAGHGGDAVDSPVGESLDECRADDGAVGVGEDLAHLLGGRDAETDARVLATRLAEARHENLGGLVDVATGAGDAHRGDGVDESPAGVDGLAEPGVT